MDPIDALLGILERTPAILDSLLAGVPQERLKERRRPGKWSVHEHVCHLAAIHPPFLDRLGRMLENLDTRITPYFPTQTIAQGRFSR